MSKKILSVSRDRAILIRRNDALAIAGFSVSSPRVPDESLHILLTTDIDIIILGHSIPRAERDSLSRAFRSMKPNVPIIVLYDGQPDADEVADAFVPVREGPEVLIQAIQACLADDSKLPGK